MPPFPFPWKWNQLGNPFGPGRWPYSMSLDPNDDPLIASVLGDLINSNGIVNAWVGTGWQQLGGNVTTRIPNFAPSIATAAGQAPAVAYYHYTGVGSETTVKLSERTGAGWQDRGGPANLHHAGYPSLIADPAGVWTVAFAEYAANLHKSKVHVDQWNGASWTRLGAPLPAGNPSGRNPSLARDPSGNVLVALEQWKTPSDPLPTIVVYRWSGTQWKRLAGSQAQIKPPSRRPKLAVGSGGDIVLCFAFRDGMPGASVRCATWTGTRWRVLPAITQRSYTNFSLAIESGGVPAVAWENVVAGKQVIDVSWWTGNGWLTFGPQMGTAEASAPLIAMSPTDQPVVAWSEGDLSVFEGPDWTRRTKAARLVPGP
jgi:hypothetical protein